MELFRDTFRIACDNYTKAAKAIRDAGLATDLPDGISDFGVLGHTLSEAGFDISTPDGIEIVAYDDPWRAEETVDFMEKVFKAVSRSVEPGSYIEFIDGETLVRYMFLYDTVERWTVPTVLYAKKEEI